MDRREGGGGGVQTEGGRSVGSVETSVCATTDLFDDSKLAIVFQLAKSDIAVKYTHPCCQSVRVIIFGTTTSV